MKFNKSLDWLKESDKENLLGDDELDVVDEELNEGLYVDPANYDKHDDLVDVVDKQGNAQKMTQDTYNKNKDSGEFKDAEPKEKKEPEEKEQELDKEQDKEVDKEPEKVITKEKRDATTAKVIDKLKEGASKMKKKYGRFNPYGQGFYSPDFFDMSSIKDDIKEILPDKLNTDLAYLGATTYANEIVYRYGEEGSDDTYAYIKVRCLASPQKDGTKFEIYSGNYEVLPTGKLSEEPIRADEYFGKDIGSGLEKSVLSLNNSIDKTLVNT